MAEFLPGEKGEGAMFGLNRKKKEKKTENKKICPACLREYPGSLRCEVSQMSADGLAYQRIKYGSAREGYGPALGKCVCCGVMPGALHHWGCMLEICPACGGQMVSCACDTHYVN